MHVPDCISTLFVALSTRIILWSGFIRMVNMALFHYFSIINISTAVVLLSVFASAEQHSSKTPSGLYMDDGNGHTVLQQEFSKNDIRELSFDILNLMGLQHRPRPHLVDTKAPSSQFLWEVYNSIANEEQFRQDVDLSNGHNGRKQDWRQRSGKSLFWSEFNVAEEEIDAIKSADEIVSFENRGHKYSSRLKKYEEDKQFWFDISEISPHDEVFSAELRLWKQRNIRDSPDDFDLIHICAHQVVFKSELRVELEELDEMTTASWEQGWISLNVTPAFREWMKTPETNFGIIISTKISDTDKEIPLSQAGIASIMDAEQHQPFMVSFLKTSELTVFERRSKLTSQQSTAHPSHRFRRSVNKSNKKKTKKSARQYELYDAMDRPKSCQMGMLYVNFEDLGWKDWVIAPDGFIAYYCHGECSFPLTASMNATNHAIVTTLVHTYYPLEYPKPACAPVKLGSISMLYYDDNSNVTVKKYKDMVIKSCGCK